MTAALKKDDLETAYHCLRAVVYGPFIEDSEFQARLGFTRSEMQDVTSGWPSLDTLEHRPEIVRAVLVCMNEVCHGIRFSEAERKFWFSESPEEIRHVYAKWQSIARAVETAGSS